MTTTNTVKTQAVWNIDVSNLIRHEELDGRQFVVVPMTMILEGVHTGSQGPVYYSVDELAKTPKMWNMKPIVLEHPFRGDTATDLEVYKKQSVGKIMNTHFTDGKLKAEAWIDKDKANEKCPEILQHIAHKLPMEISTGLFSELVLDRGTWNGEPYIGKIINIRADHLAILPKKQGACSLSDGAGLMIYNAKNCLPELNVITTTVNNDQQFAPGSAVVESLDELKETAPQPAQQQPTPENHPQIGTPVTQTFTLADGTTIAITPPAKQLEVPPPDPAANAQRYSKIEGDGVAATVQEQMSQERPETPIADNPDIVDKTAIEDGDSDEVSVMEKHLKNIRCFAQNFRAAILNTALYDGTIKNARGAFLVEPSGKFRYAANATTKEQAAAEKEYKQLRLKVADVQREIQEIMAKTGIDEYADTGKGRPKSQDSKPARQFTPEERKRLSELDKELENAKLDVLDFQKKYGSFRQDSDITAKNAPKHYKESALSAIDMNDPAVQQILEQSGILKRLRQESSAFMTDAHKKAIDAGKSDKEANQIAWKQWESRKSEMLQPVLQFIQEQAQYEDYSLGEAFGSVKMVLEEIPKINANDPELAPLYHKYMRELVSIVEDYPELMIIAPELQKIAMDYQDSAKGGQIDESLQAEIEEALPHLKDKSRSVGDRSMHPDFDPRQMSLP